MLAGDFVNFPKHVCAVQSHQFIVDTPYNITTLVGEGAQGIIAAATREVNGEVHQVAVKKIPHVLDELISCKRLLRELRLLRILKHENILGLVDIMAPPSSNVLRWKDVYMVTDLMDTDLLYILKSGQEFSDDHVQYLTYQLLSGLAFLHSANVVHRDLKPSNLLVNQNCDLKICDFGLARSYELANADEEQLLTMYVTTRWYRAPELLCLNTSYGPAVDVWSAGCILAEMIDREPLLPGKDFKDQLRLLVERVGMPSDEELQHIENEGAINYIKVLHSTVRSKPRMEQLRPNCNPRATELLNAMLCFDSSKRISAMEALQCSYVASYNIDPLEHSRNAAMAAEQAAQLAKVSAPSSLPKEQLQNLIFQEMLYFHPELVGVQWGAAYVCDMAPTPGGWSEH